MEQEKIHLNVFPVHTPSIHPAWVLVGQAGLLEITMQMFKAMRFLNGR